MIKVLAKREKAILVATIGVIIFAIGFNFFIAPILVKNDNINKEINLVRTKLKKYLLILGKKDYIQDKYSKLSSASKLPDQQQDNLVNALSELENLAKSANIRIIDIRPESALRSQAQYNEIVIDLRTEGTMEGYLKFIYDLEGSISLLRIKRFRLNARSNTQGLEGIFSISQLSIAK
jgi:capsular polysaccharide biosynthesis protein